MKKIIKKVCASLLALAMTIGMVTIENVKATNDMLFDTTKTYAIVDVASGKALNVVENTTIKANDTVTDADDGSNDKFVSKTALFSIILREDQNTVGFKPISMNDRAIKATEQIMFEASNWVTAGGGDMDFHVIGNDTDGYKIQNRGNNKYFKLENGVLTLDSSEANASLFKFVVADYVDLGAVSIKHVATGNYVKAYGTADTPLTVDGTSSKDADCIYSVVFGEEDGIVKINFISKQYNKGLASAKWGDNEGLVRMHNNTDASGWESIIFVPNGDGTISFKDCEDNRYITVNTNKNLTNIGTDNLTADTITDNEKFIIETKGSPTTPTNLAVQDNTLEGRQVGITWDNVTNCLYSGYELQRKTTGGVWETITTGAANAYTNTGLELGTTYLYRVRAFNGIDEGKTVSEWSTELSVTTLSGERPVTPTGLDIEETSATTLELTWDAVENAEKYEIWEAVSAYGNYEKVAEIEETSYEATFTTANKYYKYYKIKAVNAYGQSALTTEAVSLETELFGENTLIFADTDDFDTVDEILMDLYELQSDPSTDAQFKADHYQVYFKPGNYEELSIINLGFYTSVNGLGRTPYDTDLNNIQIPAYLSDNNATCNFWRSAENLSIINTGNAQGKSDVSWRDNSESFNWAVAQAAPLRRVYSERVVHYDWFYGWASGGYVADCYFEAVDGEGNTAGTWSGQQFYTRNTVLEGNGFGTTLNNFYQGVVADNLPTTEALLSGEGYSNWNIAKDDGGHQVVTNIETTKKLSEKPFLFLDDDGQYKVFVPAVQENTKGISWGEGKANNGMGEGTILPLEDFYIADEDDTAADINAQIAAGKHIYFTPGIYHAETPILINEDNTILLGTGLAAIIPDNSEGAIKVGDVEGIRIVGLMLDAGEHSEYLLTVGTEGTHNDASDNPIVLQDLFFRVGGTTDVLTKADNALIINADDTLCDHFWIWRADHGAGVAWDGNESDHGLIVNGDDVTCYALFNEHFQNYHTLWNGENGSTYFYQNETAYDPISQDAWMSHNGTVNGYASYKVDNDVTNHYVVGLGIYNVFIYTGPTYDASEVQIQLDNAIEVPNAEGVLVENACIQTFANEERAYQIINSIVNGVGYSVSSGIDNDDPTKVGEGWSRKFLISYNNGTAVVGKDTVMKPGVDGFKARPEGTNPKDWQLDDRGLFLGTDTITNVRALGDDNLDLKGLKELIDKATALDETKYTPVSWAVLVDALADAKAAYNNEDDFLKYAMEEDFEAVKKALSDAIDALVLKADKTDLQALVDANKDLDGSKYTAETWAAFEDAMATAEVVLEDVDVTQEDVDGAYDALDEAIKALKLVETTKPDDPVNPDDGKDDPIVEPDDGKDDPIVEPDDGKDDPIVEPDDGKDEPTVKPDGGNNNSNSTNNQKPVTGDATMVMPYAILALAALGVFMSLKKKRVN